MYPIQNGTSLLVQQTVSGTGTFDGTEYGRAKGTVPSGDPNAVVNLSARLYGTLPNAYKIQFFDMGVGSVVNVTTAALVGATLVVTLRRAALGSPLATAAEVAAVINTAQTGIVAHYGGTGNGVVTAYGPAFITNVESGVDPFVATGARDQFLWTYPANQSGGFFYFEQNEAIDVRQFEALFTLPAPASYTVTVSRVSLDPNLTPIASTAIPVFVWDALTLTRPDIAFSDANIVLHPFQALTVVVSNPGITGVVRFDVRRSVRYPYG